MDESLVKSLKETVSALKEAAYEMQKGNFDLAMTDAGYYEEKYFYHSIEYAGCYWDFTSTRELKAFKESNNLVWPIWRGVIWQPPEEGAVSHFIE